MEYIIISLALGALVGFFVVGTMKNQLKTVRHQTNASSYIRADSMQLQVSTDRYLYQNTVRTPRTKNKK